jgi:hypothetical protein
MSTVIDRRWACLPYGLTDTFPQGPLQALSKHGIGNDKWCPVIHSRVVDNPPGFRFAVVCFSIKQISQNQLLTK